MTWIEPVWHSDDIPERTYCEKNELKKKIKNNVSFTDIKEGAIFHAKSYHLPAPYLARSRTPFPYTPLTSVCVCARVYVRVCVEMLVSEIFSESADHAKHVSRTPEYWGYMGSTQSISRTIQPIAEKLSQNVANILYIHMSQ